VTYKAHTYKKVIKSDMPLEDFLNYFNDKFNRVFKYFTYTINGKEIKVCNAEEFDIFLTDVLSSHGIDIAVILPYKE